MVCVQMVVRRVQKGFGRVRQTRIHWPWCSLLQCTDPPHFVQDLHRLHHFFDEASVEVRVLGARERLERADVVEHGGDEAEEAKVLDLLSWCLAGDNHFQNVMKVGRVSLPLPHRLVLLCLPYRCGFWK